MVRRYDGATHNEASWRARLGDPLTFLFAKPGTDVNLDTPAWAADAIWYQIFVERFRNGDPSNDPTAHDVAGFTTEPMPAGWRPTPWTQDWYRPEPWAKATGRNFYGTVQFRRYGGDLQGVMDQLDYLQDLGVTALYLNPVNDAPSLHKFDARNYRHIDRNFGPDPIGDEARMLTETPQDPTTWGWTAADSLFIALVHEVHRRGMRIILDYSWNHTGIKFWAWQDVLAHQRASPYADWYEIERFDDPATRGHQRVYLPRLGRRGVPAGVEEGRPARGTDPRRHRRQPRPGRAGPGVQRDPALARPERRRRPVGRHRRVPARRGRDGAARLLARLPAFRSEHQSRGVFGGRGVVGIVAGPDVRPGAVAPGRRVRRRDELPLVRAHPEFLRRCAASPRPPRNTQPSSIR